MLDHVGFTVADFAASRMFYAACGTALGLGIVGEGDDWAMIGADGHPDLWFGTYGPPPTHVHVAFRAKDRATVREFYAAGLAAGGRDNGAPGLRPQYHANYYAAFLLDPDGQNIEAVCHTPE